MLMEKMRVTAHNGRSGKSGTYSPKHNDRNFDLQNSPHINPEKSSGNWTWTCYKGLSFDECEKKFYEQTFSKGLEEQNQRYIKNRHKERVRSINDYRSNPQTCPEETILQIGKSGDTVNPKMLQQIAIQLIAWEQKTFPNVQILDVALHVDEEGAPHMHERKVWIGHDKTGNAVVGQTKALLEMGISAPNPEKKYNRYNNPKITYTRMIREKLLDICREHGLEVEEHPKEASRNGLSLEEYKTRQETAKLAEITNEIEKANIYYAKLQKLILGAKSELIELYGNLDAIREPEIFKRYTKAIQVNDLESAWDVIQAIKTEEYEKQIEYNMAELDNEPEEEIDDEYFDYDR